MGLLHSFIQQLVDSRNDGAIFTRTLTLGKQQFYLTPKEWEDTLVLAKANGEVSGSDGTVAPPPSWGSFDDRLFRSLLGIETLDSLDADTFEGASLIHDLNAPLDGSHVEKCMNSYDAVIDGGLLEHVFNFPEAIRSTMRLCRPGGSVFIFSICNNHCGHGFYQFSPELMFRIFSPENGFKISTIRIWTHDYPGGELTRGGRLYDVIDPASTGCRVGLVSSKPAVLIVHAIKEADIAPFRIMPQQSDYQTTWRAASDGPAACNNTPRRPWIPNWVRFIYQLLWKNQPAWLRFRLTGQRQLKQYSAVGHYFRTAGRAG